MSDEAHSSQAPEEPRELRLLGFVSEHFAVFSFLGLLLVALAVMSTIIWIVQALIANAISAARLGGKTRAAAVGVIIAATFALWAISVAMLDMSQPCDDPSA